MGASSAQITGVQPSSWMGSTFIPETDHAQASNSAEAITAMVEQYSTTLYRVAYSVTRNSAEAEDAVQEAFLRVLRHRNELGEIRDHRVWLIRIVWNIVLDRKRRAKTRPETEDIDECARLLVSSGVSADQYAIAAQQHANILRQIDRLPEKERRVLLLAAFEELSTAQIAEVLKTTESAVRARLFRARRQLQATMDKEWRRV
jgi:RNA polymerase sigma-70 factor, ECF subfamily